MQLGNLLVQMLGAAMYTPTGYCSFLVNSSIWAISWFVKLLDIDEAGVPGSAAQLEQPLLGQHDHGVTAGEDPLVDLQLDVDPLDPGVLTPVDRRAVLGRV